MALIWADSFDHYGLGVEGRNNMMAGAYALVSSVVGVGPSSDQARTGAYSMYFPANVVYARRVLPGPARRVIGFGAGVFLVNLPTINYRPGLAFVDQSNSLVLNFYFQVDGAITITRGDASVLDPGVVLGATDAGVLTAGTFQHIEVAALIDPIVGWVEVRVEGITVFRLEDVNTGSAPISSIRFGNVISISSSAAMYWDDIFAWDDTTDRNNDFIGPVRILTLFSEEDGPSKHWDVVGADDMFEAIDEVPPDGDTSYIQAEEVGDRAEFVCPELPPEVIALPGIFVHTMSRIEEAGLGRVTVTMVESGGQGEVAPEQNQTAIYAYRGFVFQENPATGDIWTKEEFEAAVLRVEKTM